MLGNREYRGWMRSSLVGLILLANVVWPIARSQNSAKNVVDLQGRPVDPFRHAPGKVVVLLFVRTDCPISNRYAPTIQELSSRYAARAAFFLVYPVASESSAQIRDHLKEYGYHLPALRDPELTLARDSEVQITPEAAVFAADSRLLYHGRIDDWYVDFGRARRSPTTHDLSAAIEAAIAGKPIARPTEPAVGCYIPGVP
jgi:thiol-disulfide isomerase/thioredoxin